MVVSYELPTITSVEIEASNANSAMIIRNKVGPDSIQEFGL